MSFRIAKLMFFVGVAALSAVLVSMLWMAAMEATARAGSGQGLTKALERQNAWLASEEDAGPPPPVDDDYTGLSPEVMARCLGSNGVFSHATGLLNAPNARFGITPAGKKSVNHVISRALDRLAGAERAFMMESKLSDNLTRYELPANAAEVESVLKEIDAVVNRTLSKDVAPGFLLALRDTAAFKSYPNQHALHVSSNQYGTILSGGASVAVAVKGGIQFDPIPPAGIANIAGSFSLGLTGFGNPEETRALNLRWGHIAWVDETTGAGMWGAGSGSAAVMNAEPRDASIPAPFAVLK
jgi:hypothetical protein